MMSGTYLRSLETPQLWKEMERLCPPLEESAFFACARQCDLPEEVVQRLSLPQTLFPFVLELWRRLFPEKRALSLFCYELNYQIALFENGQMSTDLESYLIELQQLINESVDEGKRAPTEVLAQLQMMCGTDIESFLYNYIYSQIEERRFSYAKELLEGFFSFLEEKIWFSYLLARIKLEEDPEEGYKELEALLPPSANDRDFCLELLSFVAKSGHHSLFTSLAKQAFPLLTKEEDFRELAQDAMEHFYYLKLDSLALAIFAILRKRTTIPLDTPFNTEDTALQELENVISQPVKV